MLSPYGSIKPISAKDMSKEVLKNHIHKAFASKNDIILTIRFE